MSNMVVYLQRALVDYLVKGYVTTDRLMNGRPARAEREAIKNGTKIISFDDLEDMILHGKSM